MRKLINKYIIQKMVACLMIGALLSGSVGYSVSAQGNISEQVYVLFVEYKDSKEIENTLTECADKARTFLEEQTSNLNSIHIVEKTLKLQKESDVYSTETILKEIVDTNQLKEIDDYARLVLVINDGTDDYFCDTEKVASILPDNWSTNIEIVNSVALGLTYKKVNSSDHPKEVTQEVDDVTDEDLVKKTENISEIRVAEEKVDIDISGYVKLYYLVSNNQAGSICVYDTQENLVKTIYDNVYHQAGYYLATWDGKDNQNKKVNNGIYTIKLVFHNEEKSIQVEIANEQVKLTNVHLDKTDVDEADEVKFYYHVNKSTTGNIAVYDTTGNIVKKIYDNIPHQAGYYLAIWDGKKQSGEYAPAGTYKIVLRFGTEDKELSIVVHPEKIIEDVTLAEKEVVIDKNEQVRLFYNVKKPTSGSIIVYDKEGNRVKTIYDKIPHQEMRYLATWNGTNEEGKRVADGEYFIELQFKDDIQKVIVNILSPELSLDQVKLTPDSLELQHDERMRIYYNISKESLGTIRIYDENEKLVKEIYDQVHHEKGYYYAFWNLCDENGNIVSTGEYTVKIKFESMGKTVEKTISFKVAEEKKVRLEGVKLQSNQVNFANGEKAYFYYSIDRNAKGNIYIVDENGSVIREIYKNVEHESGYYMAYWDGMNADGTMVHSGNYTIRLQFGNVTKELFIRVIQKNLSLTKVYLKETTVNIENDEAAKLYYHVSKTCQGSIQVYDKKGNLVKQLYNSVRHDEGYYYLAWDLKDSDGKNVQDGTYFFKLTFTDGEKVVNETVDVNVIKGFALFNVHVDADSFNLTVGENAKIYYTINRDSYGSIAICDQNGKVIKEIYQHTLHSAGTYLATWNLNDDKGKPVEVGTYIVKMHFEREGEEAKDNQFEVKVSNELALTNVRFAKSEAGLKDGSMKIYYRVTKECTGNIEVFDDCGERIYTIYDSISHQAGYYCAIWQFVNEKGEKVDVGNYTFRLRFTDGTVTKEKTADIIVNEGIRKVWIDAGHGGTDVGAINNGRYERDDNLRLALEVQRVLSQQGISVYMSRTDIDAGYTTAGNLSSLRKRVADANEAEVDVFVSLHRDSAGAKARGYTVYTHNSSNSENYNPNAHEDKNQGCTDLAVIMNQALMNAGTFQSRGIEYGSAGSSEDLLVNRISNMPSCLLEMGYITNAADNEIFDTCLKKNAKAIAQGIMEFLKEPFDETIYTAY